MLEREHHLVQEKIRELNVEAIFCSALTGENFWRLSEYVAEFCAKYVPIDKRDSQAFNEVGTSSNEKKKIRKDEEQALKLLEEFDGKF